jgi:hypothetical protein
LSAPLGRTCFSVSSRAHFDRQVSSGIEQQCQRNSRDIEEAA